MAWLYKQAGSKYWWIGYRQNGRQILRSTRKESKADAEKILAQFNAMHEAHKAGALTQEFYHALTNTPNARRVFKAELDDWLNECRVSTAEDTHSRYNDVAKAFVEFLKADDKSPALQDISTPDVQGFLDSVRAKCAVGTANLYRRIVTMFFDRCVDRGSITKNPAQPVKKFKASKREQRVRRAFTLAEINTMHAIAPNDFWRYMIHGGFFTGLRMGDLICATWANFDFDGNMLRITAAKTGGTVSVPLAPSFKAVVEGLKKKAGRVKGSDYVWPEQAEHYLTRGAGRFSNEFYDEVLLKCGLVQKRTKKKKKQGRDGARVANAVSFHCLRHTFVSTLKLTGAHQATAKELAGHSSDEVNDIYTHTPEPVLIEAVNKLDEALKAKKTNVDPQKET
jgi:integrase